MSKCSRIRCRRCALLFVWTLATALARGGDAGNGPSVVAAVEQTVVDAVAVEAAAQAEVDVWNEERDRLLEEARGLKFELQWLELQERKLQRYVASNRDKISALEAGQARYAVISIELENSLLRDLARLVSSVETGIPFLREERGARLAFLRSSLDDPELSIGEKFRRFVEALNVEVEYGQKLEVTSGRDALDGEEIDLILLRAGRLGYYCLSLDRKRAGIWSRDKGGFVSLPEELAPAVRNVEMMAQTQQYYNFAVLPGAGGGR